MLVILDDKLARLQRSLSKSYGKVGQRETLGKDKHRRYFKSSGNIEKYDIGFGNNICKGISF